MADDFYLDYAAHVGNDVSHSTNTYRMTLGIGAVIVFVIATAVTEGGYAILTIAAVGAASRFGSAAADVGSLIDSISGPSVVGQIVTGYDAVILGPQLKPAARAMAEETKVGCDDKMIAEGSKTVVIGPDFKPMVRRYDRTMCPGIVANGLTSLMVGGVPSAEGEHLETSDPWYVRLMNVVFGLGSASRALEQRQFWNAGFRVIGAGADAAGCKNMAAIAKAGATATTLPRLASQLGDPRTITNTTERYSAIRNTWKGGAALVDLGAGNVCQ